MGGFSFFNNAIGFLAGKNPIANNAVGAYGESSSLGVFGFAKTAQGIGVAGNSELGAGIGVQGHTTSNVGVLGTCDGPGLAGKFAGNVEVTGDITLTGPGQDCAEDFDIADTERVEPGTVMVLGDGGTLRQSRQAYDKRVAGVVSGAGGFKPGLILGKQQSESHRLPIALVGKAYCKVDAQFSPVEVNPAPHG